MPTDPTWPERTAQSARDNHIWVNAFATIRPSDELLISIGRSVIRMLADPNSTQKCEHYLKGRDGEPDFHQDELIVRFNKS